MSEHYTLTPPSAFMILLALENIYFLENLQSLKYN
jgi:hypothetical protein